MWRTQGWQAMTRCLLSSRIWRLSCISSSYRLSISIQSAGFMGSKPIVILYGPAGGSQPLILSTETSRYSVHAPTRLVSTASTWLHLLGVVVLGWLYSFCLADSRLRHMFCGRTCGIIDGDCSCCASTHWHARIASSNDGTRAAAVHTTRKHSCS